MKLKLKINNEAPRVGKRLVIFNHKGGVGKTTLTVNLAFAIARLGKRVLLVDSDPQCNLTAYLVEENVVNDLLDMSDSPEGRTLWSAVKPIVDGMGEPRTIVPLELAKNLYLLPGDVRLAEFESELASLWGECFQRKPKGFRGMTALSTVITEAIASKKIDYVFYDSGPNIGALNRAILLDSDHFVIPAACDLFSLRAITTLGHTLDGWIRDWQTVGDLAPSSIPLLPGIPKLVGFVPQRFRVYRGLPAAGYASFIPKLEKRIQKDVVAVLRSIDLALVPNSAFPLKVGEVKDFGTLATASQTEGVPIFETSDASDAQRQEAFNAFASLASAIVKRAPTISSATV
jgi:cellulose biosynthesis protein BcsQ